MRKIFPATAAFFALLVSSQCKTGMPGYDDSKNGLKAPCSGEVVMINVTADATVDLQSVRVRKGQIVCWSQPEGRTIQVVFPFDEELARRKKKQKNPKKIDTELGCHRSQCTLEIPSGVVRGESYEYFVRVKKLFSWTERDPELVISG